MTQPPLTPDRLSAARQSVQRAGQEHLFIGFNQLDAQSQFNLITQMEEVDWQEVARLIQSHVKTDQHFDIPENIAPVPYYPESPPPPLTKKYSEAKSTGQTLISQGKVAAFTVAGGLGTRLGWPGPKGTYPATAIRKLPMFASMAEYLRKIQQKYGTPCRWYIMTSTLNDEATRTFFHKHGYFGLEPDSVTFFPQAMMPAIDPKTCRVLLESPSSLALSPNGHGGSLKALYTSGALEDMKQHGIEQISYTQIDNPMVKVIDPIFLGLHTLDQCQMSSKMVPKTSPEERLGNFCLVDGHVAVIEYSDLPSELAHQKMANDQLRFNAGSIAIHAIRVDFVDLLNHSSNGFGLPYHRADKKVPYFDTTTGNMIEPETPNAVKLETFVFDALPMCDSSIVYETQRQEEFAPIKNAHGVDSAETSRNLLIERAGRWLEANGVQIPRTESGQVDAVIEISQLTAIESSDLSNITLPKSIERNTEVLL